MNDIKKCKHCKSNINKSDKICPYCNKKQGLPTWVTVLIVIIIFSLIGSTEDNVDNVDKESNTLASVTSSVIADTTVKSITDVNFSEINIQDNNSEEENDTKKLILIMK